LVNWDIVCFGWGIVGTVRKNCFFPIGLKR